MRLPRRRAIFRSGIDSRSSPAKVIRFAVRLPELTSRFITASALTDLPQPDSPTMQCVSPRPMRNEAPRTAAVPLAEGDGEVFDLQQRRAHRGRSAPRRLRRPSPTKLTPITKTNRVTPGIMITHGEKNM